MKMRKLVGRFAVGRLGVVVMAGVLTAMMLLPSCKAHHQYPDLTPGWHSADYSKLFGRVQRVAQKDPTAKPVWVLRYGYGGSDQYSGKLNLFPDGAMAGYNGGELVEIKGSLAPEFTLPNFEGSWYKVDEIRMWTSNSTK